MTSRHTASIINQLFERQIVYQKTSGKPPSPELAAAMAKFEAAQLAQIAERVANVGGLPPRNLTDAQRRAVMAMVKQARNII